MQETINQLPTAVTIDPSNDLLPIFQNSSTSTLSINRNTYLSLASAPVGLTDTQTITNKTLTSPTINGATLSGTLSGTYIIGGTPTFPSSVVQLTSTQTLTNKTLTSPTINSPTITNASLTTDSISGYTTSNAGTIYGIAVSGGQITGSSTVTNAALASGVSYSKFYNPYKFYYYQSTNITGFSGQTEITLNTQVFDTGSNYSNSTGKFTAPVSGFYQFNYSVNYAGSSANEVNVLIYKNGSVAGGGTQFASSGSVAQTAVGSMLLQLSSGDYIQLYGYSGTSITIYSGPATTYFQGYLVSAT